MGLPITARTRVSVVMPLALRCGVLDRWPLGSLIINWVVRALNADWLTAMVYHTVYHGYYKTCTFTALITLVTSL
jgi:hypothetical protein